MAGVTDQDWSEAMRNGEYEAAWAISDVTLAARDPATRDDPTLPYHLRWVWAGKPPDGRDVLVRCYHGLGDTIQFARFLPRLAQRAKSLTVEIQPELRCLFEEWGADVRLVPFREDRPLPPSDCDIEIMELCHVLRLRPEDISVPYLAAMRHSVSSRRRSRPILGLCWRSGAWDEGRSIPLKILATTLAGLNVDLLSLQDENALAEMRRCEVIGFVNRHDIACGIDRLIRVMLSVDLVICVDTMVAHLAGALGIPVWILLKAAPDWRWSGAVSPWYPAARLYRQEIAGDWSGVLRRLRSDLIAFLGAKTYPAMGE